jgi:hypothetical protein
MEAESPDEVKFKMDETITPSIAEGIVFKLEVSKPGAASGLSLRPIATKEHCSSVKDCHRCARRARVLVLDFFTVRALANQ